MKEIIIKPIRKSKFSKISAYDKSKTVFSAQQERLTGLYKTGLTDEQEREYEKKLKLPEGTLNRKSPYWGDVDIQIKVNNDRDTRLIIASPIDELKEKILFHRSDILSPGQEQTPDHQFVIYDPEASAKVESVKIDYELEANEKFIKLPVSEKRDILRLYGKRGVDTMSEDLIKSELWKQVKSDCEGFLNKINDPTIKTKILVEKLLEKGIVKRTNNNHYMYGDEHIGSSMEDVVGYLNDVKNQKIKLNFQSKVKGE